MKFIQLGDSTQCHLNSLDDWAVYEFGRVLRSHSPGQYSAYHRSAIKQDGGNGNNDWNSGTRHRTSFYLELKLVR